MMNFRKQVFAPLCLSIRRSWKRIEQQNAATQKGSVVCLFRIFYFSCSIFPLSTLDIYIFLCCVCGVYSVLYQHRLLSCVTPVFGCCFTIHGNCIFRLLIRRPTTTTRPLHNTFGYTCYFLYPAKKGTLEKRWFASQQNWIFRFEYLDTRLVGTYNNEWYSVEGNVQENMHRHIFRIIRDCLSSCHTNKM